MDFIAGSGVAGIARFVTEEDSLPIRNLRHQVFVPLKV